MPTDRLVELLKEWYDEQEHSAENALPRRSECPSLAALYLHVVEGVELSDTPVGHVSHCPACARLRDMIAVDRLGPFARWRITRTHRIDRSSSHARPGPSVFRGYRLGRKWPAFAGLATAAALVISFFAIRHAFAFDLREPGYARPIPTLAFVPPGTAMLTASDSQWIAETEIEIATYRAELEQARSLGTDPWQSWVPIYRNLRALGRWDEALAEMHAFVEFAHGEDEKTGRYSMFYSGVFDLGETYAALGDYDKAKEYHQQSLTLASDSVERTKGDQDTQSAAYAGGVASTLLPRLDALSNLAAAKGDEHTAWQFHNQATELLAEYFRLECKERGLNASLSASLVDLCLAVVADGGVPESPVVKVREHLLREARLHRLDRNLDAAEQALNSTKDVPVYPHADESRLDFNEPMEWVRIKIGRGQFQSALDFAGLAEQHTGPRKFECCPSQPPIGVVARAEVQYLKGVATAGLNKRDPEAIRLIEKALAGVTANAASFPSSEREMFLMQFESWEATLERLGGRSKRHE